MGQAKPGERAALIGVSVAATVALVSLGLLDQARLRAARDRAEDRSRLARRAVNEMYTDVAEQWLSDEPLMDDLKRKFLRRALDIYEQLAEMDTNDPSLLRETALAQFRMGQIYRQFRRDREAGAAYDRAIALQQELLASSPGDKQYRQDLANSCNWKGELLGMTSHPRDALPLYAEALALQKALATEFPDEPAFRKEQARSHYNRGLARSALGDLEGARQDMERAIDLLAELERKHPDVPDYTQELARVYLNLGGKVFDPLRKDAEATRCSNLAIRRLERLHERFPSKSEYRRELAVAYNNLGNLKSSRGQPAEARRYHDEARALLTKLVADFPARPVYQKELANTWNSIGAVLARLGGRARNAQAEEAWQRSFTLFAKLSKRWPEAAEYHDGVAQALGNLGWLTLRQDRPRELRADLEGAVDRLRTARKIDPDNKDYRIALRNEHKSLAGALLQLGETGPAAREARAVADSGVSPDLDRYLAASLLARCAGTDRDAAAARAYADETVSLLRRMDARKVDAALRLARWEAPAQPLARAAGLLALAGGHGPLLAASTFTPGRLPPNEFLTLWLRPDFQDLLRGWRSVATLPIRRDVSASPTAPRRPGRTSSLWAHAAGNRLR